VTNEQIDELDEQKCTKVRNSAGKRIAELNDDELDKFYCATISVTITQIQHIYDPTAIFAEAKRIY